MNGETVSGSWNAERDISEIRLIEDLSFRVLAVLHINYPLGWKLREDGILLNLNTFRFKIEDGGNASRLEAYRKDGVRLASGTVNCEHARRGDTVIISPGQLQLAMPSYER